MTDITHPPPQDKSDKLLHWATIALVTTVWASALLFGLYILAFYVAAFSEGDLSSWNGVLPGLYVPDSTAATIGIGIHFAAGGIILILGSIQLIEWVRVHYLNLHRWLGRIYVVASLLAAIGGLTFIAINGTIGGTVMDIGFGLYGILMFIAGIQTYRHAKNGNLDTHRAWAWRLYALAIGSWLYRMDYGFWYLFTDGLGSTDAFTGIFDQIMSFFFYIPNLILVEVLLRARTSTSSTSLKIITSLAFILAVAFLGTGTYFFTLHIWGPEIVGFFG